MSHEASNAQCSFLLVEASSLRNESTSSSSVGRGRAVRGLRLGVGYCGIRPLTFTLGRSARKVFSSRNTHSNLLCHVIVCSGRLSALGLP